MSVEWWITKSYSHIHTKFLFYVFTTCTVFTVILFYNFVSVNILSVNSIFSSGNKVSFEFDINLC